MVDESNLKTVISHLSQHQTRPIAINHRRPSVLDPNEQEDYHREEYFRELARNQLAYDSATWLMYYRIMNYRRIREHQQHEEAEHGSPIYDAIGLFPGQSRGNLGSSRKPLLSKDVGHSLFLAMKSSDSQGDLDDSTSSSSGNFHRDDEMFELDF
jgi:hypothetical protein